MIVTIVILLFAFYWLMRETNYLRVRLLTGNIPQATIAEVIPAETKPTSPIDNTPGLRSNTSDFSPLDIPEYKGELNIISRRC